MIEVITHEISNLKTLRFAFNYNKLDGMPEKEFNKD
jgi:hypothetical protein